MHRLAFAVSTVLALSAQTLPKVDAILNGGSFGTRLCPGAMAALFGSQLASTTVSAEIIPLPTELAGTKVLIQDPSMPAAISAPLYFVSPGQINFQVPFELVRRNITITVSTFRGNSSPYSIDLDPMAPGILSQTANGAGDALIFDANFQLLRREPEPGSIAILYATGLGPTTPQLASGSGGSTSPPFNVVANPFDVYVGGEKATVMWAGLAPGFVGVYQLNLQLPSHPVGDIFITCGQQCDEESKHVRMPRIDTGDNVANATGSVTILYPSGQPKLTFSPGFVIAKITAQFDIKPAAARFTLQAVATIGSTRVDATSIQFDPAAKKFTAVIPSPTYSVRGFNFSHEEPAITVWDFLCGRACPMPGNIVPLSRIDPLLVTAMRTVPQPNATAETGSACYTTTATFDPGSTFVMNETKNVNMLVFASFGAIPYPEEDVPVTVALYVDGQMIGTATSVYRHP